jgi:hypothetical protein
VTGRPRPHPISRTDSILHCVLDELEGLRADLAQHFARAFPESPAPQRVQDPPAGGPVAVDITEPAVKPATPPRKRAAKKVAPPASKEN